jgi:hypothetical protein
MKLSELICTSSALCLVIGSPAVALEINESNLWFGDGDGIEIVSRTGENLAYADDHPNVDPAMTHFARGMDQALLKIGDNAYLAYGWDITSPMMVVGDSGRRHHHRPADGDGSGQGDDGSVSYGDRQARQGHRLYA